MLNTTLQKLYQSFFEETPQLNCKAEIENNHQELIQTLSKSDRRKVLRIIDAATQIPDLKSEESFVCGFKLGLNLMIELQKYEQIVFDPGFVSDELSSKEEIE